MINNTLLVEIAAEVCYKMGGIHTVISTKASYTGKDWGRHYILLGAYMGAHEYNENNFEPLDAAAIPIPAVQRTISFLHKNGFSVHAGKWKIEGEPLILLLDLMVLPEGFTDFKNEFLRLHSEPQPRIFMVEAYLRFGFCVYKFFEALQFSNDNREYTGIIAHFHEYMTAIALPKVKQLGIRTVFTTHATVAGRLLSSLFPDLYKKRLTQDKKDAAPLPFAYQRFCESLERQAAREAHVFTTVSEPMAVECLHFLDRYPDVVTPNGLNIALIKAQSNTAADAVRKRLDAIVDHHFLPDKSMNGTRRFYFFTSGRYDYKAKGYDIVIAALARFNEWIKKEGHNISVVMFFITNNPPPGKYAVLKKAREFCRQALSVNGGHTQTYFLHKVPLTVHYSELIRDLKKNRLSNRKEQPVKAIYYPQFISKNGPVLDMDYMGFAGACDLGLFPSIYEPWGYTPVECLTAGTPALTTNVSGVGDYIKRHTGISEREGIAVVDRYAKDLPGEIAEIMKQIVTENPPSPNLLQHQARLFDWNKMMPAYCEAHQKAIQ
jgi:glycogen synthase